MLCGVIKRIISGRTKFLIAFVLIVAVGLPTYRQLGIDLCPLHRFAGMPCPACGVTRSTWLLLHGDFNGAFSINPLWLGLVLCIPLVCVVDLLFSVVGRRLFVKDKRRAWIIAICLVVLNWIYLIIKDV